MIFRSFARFCTNQYGVPHKFLDAMKFEIPKSPEERYVNVRLLANRIQDRLPDEVLSDFYKDFLQLKDRNITCANNLKSQLFKLFNHYQLLDLVPLCLKVDIQDLRTEFFEDEFKRIQQDYESDYKELLSHKASLFRPSNKSLTDLIGYERKHHLTQTKKRQDYRLTKFEEGLDAQLIQFLKQCSENSDTQTTEQLQFEDKLQLFRQQRIIKQKLPQITQREITKSSLVLRLAPSSQHQIQHQPSAKVGFYSLPCKLDADFKAKFEESIRQMFGDFLYVQYFEYATYRQIKTSSKDVKLDPSNENQKAASKFIQRIQQHRNKRLNQSYAVIEFKDMETKNKLLSPDLRIFGFKYGEYLIKLDDVDFKRVVYINNCHKHRSVNELVQFLESRLKTKIEAGDERRLISSNVVTLVCNSYNETLQVFKQVDKQIFNEEISTQLLSFS